MINKKINIIDISEFHILSVKECELCGRVSKTARVYALIDNKDSFLEKWIFSCYVCALANSKKIDRDFILDVWRVQDKQIRLDRAKYYLTRLEKKYNKRKILRIIRLLLEVQGFNNHNDFLNAVVYFHDHNKLGYKYYKFVRSQISKFKRKRENKDAAWAKSTRSFHSCKTSEYHLGAGSCGFP